MSMELLFIEKYLHPMWELLFSFDQFPFFGLIDIIYSIFCVNALATIAFSKSMCMWRLLACILSFIPIYLINWIIGTNLNDFPQSVLWYVVSFVTLFLLFEFCYFDYFSLFVWCFYPILSGLHGLSYARLLLEITHSLRQCTTFHINSYIILIVPIIIFACDLIPTLSRKLYSSRPSPQLSPFLLILLWTIVYILECQFIVDSIQKETKYQLDLLFMVVFYFLYMFEGSRVADVVESTICK